MTQISFPGGMMWPSQGPHQGGALSNSATLNAATDKLAMIGYVFISGRPGSAKTFGGGSSAVSFRTGGSTFANASTNIDIGLQNVSTSAGAPGQPDGTFDAYSSFAGNGGGIVTSAWNNCAVGSGNGTMSVTNGDLIAVVLDMTARAGGDSVVLGTLTPASVTGMSLASPGYANLFDGGIWGSGQENQPNVVLTFSDGTIGTLSGAGIWTTAAEEAFNDAPDERGIKFQVPFDCKCDGIWAFMCANDDTANFSAKLYSDPVNSASAVSGGTVSCDASTVRVYNAIGMNFFPFAAEISLSKSADYGVTILATAGASNVRHMLCTAASSAYLALLPSGTAGCKITRDGSSGNFTATTTATYPMGVRISSVDDGNGVGGSGGLIRNPGMTGGLNA